MSPDTLASPRVRSLVLLLVTATLVWCGGLPAAAQTEAPTPAASPAASPTPAALRKIGEMEVSLVGVSATVEPLNPVVPKNTASGVRVIVRSGGEQLSAAEVERFLGGQFRVEGELSGPGLRENVSLPEDGAASGGDPLLLRLPALASAGDYSLTNLRLVVAGAPVLDVNPHRVGIKVIDQILITSVTTRPLTLEEIRARGIVLDNDSYLGFEFSLGLSLDSRATTFTFPVVFDQRGVAVPQPNLPQPDPTRAEMPPLTSIVPLLLTPRQPGASMPRVRMPNGAEAEVRIPSVLVIPGNVGYLKQFFSAKLFVANGAPGGSGLTVQNVTGKIRLPGGADQVPATADDPLTLPDTEQGPQPATRPVRADGPDGAPGTADDVGALNPGEQGQAEFTIRGEREGFHNVEFDIDADLTGLATGPVRVSGRAGGGVLVRNPYFDMAFTVPGTVRRGERFKVFATVNNISESLANDVRVTLDASRMSGAHLVGDITQSIDTLRPRDSRTLEFEFESERTGQVVASYLRFDTQNGTTGEVRFTLGVGERGVALSPDTLVLPSAVDRLPADVVAAAMRVLGQAWSIANAPSGTLPRDVIRTGRNVVTQKAIALAEAGLRVELGQPSDDAVRDLVFDFYGGSPVDPGFDQLLRRTEAGRDFLRVVGARLAPAAAAAGGAPDYERGVAQLAASGPDFITFSVSSASGAARPLVALTDAQNRRSATSEASPALFDRPEVPGAALVPFGAESGAALGVLTAPDSFPYMLEFTGRAAGVSDVSVTVPGSNGNFVRGELRGLEMTPGGRYRVTLDGSGGPGLTLKVDADGDGTAEAERPLAVVSLTPRGPQFVSATVIGPETLSGASPFGYHLALLFDRVVDAASAARKENYSLPSNAVVSARRQLSGRLVFATLEQPEGPYVPTTVGVSDVADMKERTGPGGTHALGSRLKEPGAVVSGRVFSADGAAVRSAVVTYAQNPVIDCAPPLDDYAGLSSARTGADGRYELRYVRQDACGLPFRIMTRDAATGSVREVSNYVRLAGEQMVLDIALFGRGAVAGTVRDLSARPVAGATVVAVSGTDPQVGGTATTDADGRYTIGGITVGPVSVKAVKGASLGRGTGRVDRAGTTSTIDLTLDGGAVRLSGVVRRVEGGRVAPVSDLQVVYYASGVPVAVVRTGLDGSYAFEGMPTGAFAVVAALNTRDRATLTGVAAAGEDLRRDIVIEVGGYGTLRGSVRYPDGSAAAGILLSVDDRGALSGDDGSFELPGVAVRPNVAQTVRAISRDGLRRGQASFFVNQPGQTVEGLGLTLSGLGAVEFVVLDAARRPVVGQDVALLGDCDNECGCVAGKTDASGRVRFENLPLGPVLARAIRVVGATVDQAEAAVTVTREGATTSGVLAFGGFGVVSGTVLDPDGRPVLGAEVSLVSKVFDEDNCRLRDGVSHRQRTDQTGKFRFTGVNVGQVSVTVTHPFFPASVGQKGNVSRSGEEVVFGLRLVNTISGELSGIVFLPDGVTPAGAGVEVTANGALPDVTVVTNEQGRYRFAKIFPEGNYTVSARDAVTGGLAQAQVYLRAAQDVTHDLRLKGRGTVRVRVVNGADEAVPAARLKLQESEFPARVYEAVIEPADQGVATFENVFEGRLSVEASDAFARGGRASAVLARPGDTVEVKVTLTTTGSVRGRFLRPDSTTPIPFGIVRLVAGGRTIGQSTTQGTGEVGAFAFDYVPAGQFRLEAQDPLTGRTGFAVGSVESEGQIVALDVRAQGLGTVRGVVTSNGAPQAGARVEVASGSFRAGTIADNAGRYLVEGVPEGRVAVTASLDGNFLSGTASASLAGEGATLLLDVALRDSGRVTGRVYAADGATPAGLSLVTIQVGGAGGGTQQTTSDEQGRFVFDRVPAGLASIGVELFGSIDRGRSTLDVQGSRDNDVAVTLNGVGSVRGRALDSAGQPVAGDVSVNGTGPFPYSFTVRVPASGAFAVGQVSAGPFTATLRAQSGDFTLYGTTSGAVSPAAETNFDVQVQPSGTVTGIVMRSDATTPAYGADVVLQLDRNRGSVGVQAGPDGRFTARGVPLGALLVRLNDPVTTGLGLVGALTLSHNGETVDAGTIVLDDTPVTVVSFDPADGAQRVAPGAPIRVAFSDPLQSLAGIKFSAGADHLNLSGALSADRRTATFTGALPSGREITVDVTTGVRDLYGRALAAPAASRFSTADVVPPSVVSVAPAHQAAQVAEGAALAVVFSEPLAATTNTAALISLGGPAGAVAGTTALTAPATAVFTPAAPLQTDAVYSVTVVGAADESGNTQATPFRSTFTTRDTVAPTLRLDAPADGSWVATARPQIRVTASDSLSGVDAAAFTLKLDGQRVAATAAGNTLQFTPPADLSQGAHALDASASDRAGNAAALGATFKVDTVAPGPAQLSGVTADQTVRGIIRLGAAAEDATSGVKQIDVYSDAAKILTLAAPAFQSDYDVSLLGEGAHTLTARATDTAGNAGPAGAPVRVVVDSAVALPLSPYDANGFLYDVDRDGSSRVGHHLSFSGAGGPEAGSFLLDVMVGGATTRFNGPGGARVGSTELGGRQIVVRQQNLSGLDVTRKVYVPRGGYFARHVEIVSNPTAAPITFGLRVVNNAGSTNNGVPRVMHTSNGNLTVEAGGAGEPDRWFSFDDASDTDPFVDNRSLPSMGFAFDGAGARRAASAVTFGGYTTPWSPGQPWNYGPARTSYEWGDVTVQPGESVAFMHFAAQQTSRGATRLSLERLVQLPAESIAGLTAGERAQVQNFNVPAEGAVSALEPLPEVEGTTVTGRVFAGDNTTPVPGTAVTFRSQNPLFARTYTAASGADGAFAFASALDRGQSSVAIPAGPFALGARHPLTGVAAPAADGTFPAGERAATRDVVFSNTGGLRGTVRRGNGALITGGSVQALGGNPFIGVSAGIGVDGTFFLSGLPPGSYTLTVSEHHPQGSPNTAAATVTVAAGQNASADLTLPATGGVTGVVRTAAGAPSSGTYVRLRTESYSFWRETSTNAAGQFAFGEVPAGTYVVEAQEPRTSVWTNAGVTVTAGQSAAVELALTGTGRVQVQANRADGSPAAGVHVYITEARRGYERYLGDADAAGRLTTGDDVAVGDFTVRVVDWQNGHASAQAAGRVAADGDVTQVSLTLPGTGTVAGRVTFAGGAPAAGAYVEVYGADVPYRWTYTDENGNYGIGSVVTNRPFEVRAYSPDFYVTRALAGHVIESNGATLTVDVTLPARATLRVTAHASDGSPLAGAMVRLRDSSRPSPQFVGYTDPAGVLSVENVVEGEFLVQVFDPQTGAFRGSAAGSILPEHDGQTVSVDVEAPALGSIQGRVYAADGATALASVYLELYDATGSQHLGWAQTDGLGAYRFESLAPRAGGFLVRAYSPNDYAIRVEASGVVVTPGAATTIDLRLPVSVVRGVVRYNDGVTPAGYPQVVIRQTDAAGSTREHWSHYGDENGNYLVLGAGVGDFTVVAWGGPSSLRGTATGRLESIDAPASVDVTLPPSGAVTGTVYDASNNPAPYARVALTSASQAYDQYAYADERGAFRFEHIGLGGFALSATLGGTFGSATGSVNAAGDEVAADIRLAGVGTLRGTVFGADGVTPLAGAHVVVENFEHGGAQGSFRRTVTADGSGNYVVGAVQAGAVQVSAFDPSELIRAGMAEGTLTTGQTSVVDVALGNAHGIGYGAFNLDGADGFRYDVHCDGSLGDGGTSDGRLSDAYDGAYYLKVNGDYGRCAYAGRLDQGGRGITLGGPFMSGLKTARKIFSPAGGGFTRYLEVLSNPTATAITVDVEVEGYMGSDSATKLLVTPAAGGGHFAVTDQDEDCCDPAVAHVFAGPGARLATSAQFADGRDDVYYRWRVTVAPGQTVMLMHFTAQRETHDGAAARAQAERLVDLTDPGALAGMSPEEKSRVLNFTVPVP